MGDTTVMKRDEEEKEEEEEEEENEEEGEPTLQDKKAAAKQRLANLRAKVVQARNLNKAASLEEYRRKTEGEAAVEAKRRKDAWLERKCQHDKDVAAGLADPAHAELGITAAQVEERQKKKRKKEKGQAAFGWDVFNVDTAVKTQKKRLAKVHESFGEELQEKYERDKAMYEADPTKKDDLQYSIVDEPTDEMRARLKQELAVTQQRRSQFSRRRAFNEDADVDYINDRNKKFNEKLKRHFDSFTTEIRQNLERGTAL